MTEMLELLSFDLLAQQIRAKKDAARADDAIAGWDKLLEVVTELIGSSEDNDTNLLAARTWTLVGARLAGYQGISAQEPLVLALDPTPGVTVIHGPNGSGKSSVADAIETGLQGRVRPPNVTGRGGQAPLWERVHCGRDAEQATIELTLACRDERLHLRCSLDKEGATREYVATHIVDRTSRVVDLEGTDWRSAVIGHRPVFAYAALERRVQRASDLQEFLEDLLAFGNAFDALKERVDHTSAEAKRASSDWAAELKAARARVSQVDSTTRRDDRPALDDLTWPSVGADPDQWLADAGLTDSGAAVPEVTVGYGERLRRSAAMALTAITTLQQAETSLHARLADPLRQLHGHVNTLDDPGDVCPVCDAVSPTWQQSLTRTFTI